MAVTANKFTPHDNERKEATETQSLKTAMHTAILSSKDFPDIEQRYQPLP